MLEGFIIREYLKPAGERSCRSISEWVNRLDKSRDGDNDLTERLDRTHLMILVHEKDNITLERVDVEQRDVVEHGIMRVVNSSGMVDRGICKRHIYR